MISAHDYIDSANPSGMICARLHDEFVHELQPYTRRVIHLLFNRLRRTSLHAETTWRYMQCSHRAIKLLLTCKYETRRVYQENGILRKKTYHINEATNEEVSVTQTLTHMKQNR